MFKILVVEDDRELNKVVCSYLTQNGYPSFDAITMNLKPNRP